LKDKTERENVEVGHLTLKSSFNGTHYQILLLLVSVTIILPQGCPFQIPFGISKSFGD
jgi:hypothetical protein